VVTEYKGQKRSEVNKKLLNVVDGDSICMKNSLSQVLLGIVDEWVRGWRVSSTFVVQKPHVPQAVSVKPQGLRRMPCAAFYWLGSRIMKMSRSVEVYTISHKIC
jgi:hypothetical protein